MLIAVLGIIVLIVGIVLKNSPDPSHRFAGIVRIAGAIIVLLGLAVSATKIVNPGEVGVQVLFGQVQNQVLRSGLHFINPAEDVTTFSVETQNYTMSAKTNEGQIQGDDAIRVLSSDGLEVTIDLSVLYNVDPDKAPFILQNIGPAFEDYQDKIVRPITRTAIRNNAVNYQAIDLYSTKRGEFQQKITEAIKSNFAKNGLHLQQVLVRNISLPESVQKSIEAKIQAEQDAETMQFVLQKEKQEADRKRIEAQGIADYQRIISKGLTPQQLQYQAILAQKEIATSANAKVIIIGSGKGAPVLISDK